jgi:hypothetical protein
MKKFLTLVFSFTAFVSFGQFTAALHYSLGLPQGSMAKNIHAVHQGGLSVGYRLPKALRCVQVGADLSYGGYGSLSMPVELQFGNGRPTQTTINYQSNVFAANVFLQVDLFKKGIITPYLMLKGGIQDFHSSIYVEDPNDIDGCRPLENEDILSDETMTFSYGGGLRFQLPMPNCSNHRVRQHFIDVQVLAIRGGNLDYINTRDLADHGQHVMPKTSDEDGRPLEMRFINVTSNVVHAHKVAEIHTSPLRLLDIKVGYFIQF